MRAPKLKATRRRLGWSHARLAAAIGTTTTSVTPQERGELVLSKRMANLVRMIEGGVDVEAFAHKGRGRRDCAAKPTKGSDASDPKSEGRQRARKGSV